MMRLNILIIGYRVKAVRGKVTVAMKRCLLALVILLSLFSVALAQNTSTVNRKYVCINTSNVMATSFNESSAYSVAKEVSESAGYEISKDCSNYQLSIAVGGSGIETLQNGKAVYFSHFYLIVSQREAFAHNHFWAENDNEARQKLKDELTFIIDKYF